MTPTLALTLGDPAGIGPETMARALADPQVRRLARLVVYGDPALLHKGCEVARVRLDPVVVARPADVPEGSFGVVVCGEIDSGAHAFGTPRREDGAVALAMITRAVAAASSGEVDGVVTAPINKEHLSAATGRTEGHTELLARLTGSPRAVMMLAGPNLRVVSATSHASIRDVAERITGELIRQQARVLHDGLRRFFRLARPRIAVCALNPHCGEGGLYGCEEEERIAPAVRSLVAAGIDAVGPLPADTVFVRARSGEFDAVLAMYHDQAMIPIKLLAFERAVNVTLGLPIVRTSPAHGTAYDLAGQGTASAESTQSAIRLAAAMARCARADGEGAG